MRFPAAISATPRFVLFLAAPAALLLAAAPAALHAQDTRSVTEPKLPPACTVLKAGLRPAGISLAPADESRLDTDRIQSALNACTPGHAVELAAAGANTAFLSGPLELRDGVSLLVDKGVTVFASTDPRVFEIPNPEAKAGDAGKCGTSTPRPTSFPTFSMNAGSRPRGGCRPLITINAKNSGIFGEGTLDGRGYAKLQGHDYSWWELARKAQPNDDLYYSVRLIVANGADNLVLYGIHLVNSPNYHVTVGNTDGFTAWNVHLQTPVDKHFDARNTDGIDPGGSRNITVAHSWIDNGDDNIAVKQGVSHMSVLDNHFYSGHGMSIGSETVKGQSFLLVDGLVEDHTTSGIRIKSNVKRGGPVHDLVYENICMRDVPIPIAISPYYTNQTVEPFTNPNYTGDLIPDYKGITLRNIFSLTPGDVLIAGLNEDHRTQVNLDHVVIQGIKPEQVHLHFADFGTAGTGANFKLTGESVKIMATMRETTRDKNKPGQTAAQACAGKFLPYR